MHLNHPLAQRLDKEFNIKSLLLTYFIERQIQIRLLVFGENANYIMFENEKWQPVKGPLLSEIWK